MPSPAAPAPRRAAHARRYTCTCSQSQSPPLYLSRSLILPAPSQLFMCGPPHKRQASCGRQQTGRDWHRIRSHRIGSRRTFAPADNVHSAVHSNPPTMRCSGAPRCAQPGPCKPASPFLSAPSGGLEFTSAILHCALGNDINNTNTNDNRHRQHDNDQLRTNYPIDRYNRPAHC